MMTIIEGFEFMEADLALNRQGMLSDQQRNRLKEKEIFWKRILLISLLLAVIASGISVIPSYNAGVTRTIAVCGWGTAIYSALKRRLYVLDLTKDDVHSIEGQLVLTSYVRPGYGSYTVLICGEWFKLSKTMFNSLNRLKRNNPCWIIYYSPHTHSILSLEESALAES